MVGLEKPFRLRGEYRFEYAYHLSRLSATEIAPLLDFVDSDSNIVFDVGASVGRWTKAWLDTFGDRTEAVHMFEPLSVNAGRIRNRLRHGFYDEYTVCSNKLHVHQTAIGDAVGETNLHYTQNKLALASIVHDACNLPDKSIDLEQSVQVPVTTIDTFCAENEIPRIDVMKVDTEGSELQVLRGSERMLMNRAVGVILFEFGLGQVASRHVFRDFWDLLTGHGYRMSRLGLGRQGWGLEPLPVYQGRLEALNTRNVYLAQRT